MLREMKLKREVKSLAQGHSGSTSSQHVASFCLTLKSMSLYFAAVAVVELLCPTPCDPMDCSLPGSSIRGIFQARVLKWGAIAFSKFCYV